MVRVIYRFNIFGSKEARNKMMQNRGPGFGGPGFGGPGMGGRGMGGGRRPF